jgi:antitoxin component YwqK of YwqJK toxin-antitoxin module
MKNPDSPYLRVPHSCYYLLLILGSLFMLLSSRAHGQDLPIISKQIRDTNERLLMVSDQFSTITGSTAAGIGTSYSWMVDGENLVLLRYTTEGLLAEKLNYGLNGELRESENFTYEKFQLVSRTLFNAASKQSIISRYNFEGKLVQQETLIAGIKTSEQGYSYSDNGKLTNTIKTGGRQDGVSISYLYNSQDQLVLEEWYQNQQLQKKIIYSTDIDYIVEHFDNGSLFAKDYYVAAIRKRQELFRNGIVVRQRIFE